MTPEQDEIDRLVTTSMKRGIIHDRYDNDISVCPVCGAPWHGLRGNGLFGRWGCPGEYGTEAEKRAYEARVKPTGNDDV